MEGINDELNLNSTIKQETNANKEQNTTNTIYTFLQKH
jgi:hypothetical protein